MAERLLKIKKRKGCDSLIMLGDVKDYIMGMEPKAIHYLNSFINPLLKEFKHISIVPGNHDAGLETLLPQSISFTGSRGMIVRDREKKIALLHGHAFPAKGIEDADIFIFGHMHLILNIANRIEPLWVRLRFRMNENDKMAIIVPPFNELLSGYLPKDEEKSSSFADFVLRNASHAEALLLDGTTLGDPRIIREGLAEVEY
jgi:metallophosphoesterase superfamily enzyme